MELLDLTCPHCGAPLKVDSALTRATCEHCGATLLIDRQTHDVRIVNAEEAGYDFERGRMRARSGRTLRIAAAVVSAALLLFAAAVLLRSCNVSTEDHTSPAAPSGSTEASDMPEWQDVGETAAQTPDETLPSVRKDTGSAEPSAAKPSPVYVFVRTETDPDGAVTWYFTFSNHGEHSIEQIILCWQALDAQGNAIPNLLTDFTAFEKGWNITGSPLAPGYALDEVSPENFAFNNPAYAETRLVMVAVTYGADGGNKQVVLDNSYTDVSNVPCELGEVQPSLA